MLPLAPLACGGPTFVISQYQGPVRPRETIAILRMDGGSPVQLVSVDGEPLAPVADDVRLHIEVLPGEHSVGVANMAQGDQPAQRVLFLAEAGKLYGAAWTAAGNPRIFEIDAASGAPIRDVSLIKPEEPPPEPPRPVTPLPPVQPPAPQPLPPVETSPEPAPAPLADAGPPPAPLPPP